jgi:nickel/cobalt transporter (NicO) family protein
MAHAIVFGATSGALHAITGPDHLLSLGPAALARAKQAFRLGFLWGVGHGGGTLVLALLLLVASAVVDLRLVNAVSERAAGVVLGISGLLALRASRNSARGSHAHSASPGAPLRVGFFHGATGASALLLLTPALAAPDKAVRLGYLLAFIVGSTLAMAALTGGVGALAARLPLRSLLPKVEKGMAWLSMGVGGTWLLLGAAP